MSRFDDKIEQLKTDITGHLDAKLKMPLKQIRYNQERIKDLYDRAEENKDAIKEVKGEVKVVNEKAKGNRRVIAYIIGFLTVAAGCLLTYALTAGR